MCVVPLPRGLRGESGERVRADRSDTACCSALWRDASEEFAGLGYEAGAKRIGKQLEE